MERRIQRPRTTGGTTVCVYTPFAGNGIQWRTWIDSQPIDQFTDSGPARLVTGPMS
ncbi:hypothetical protein RSAG8_12615, partial [Rhizoctonia solani AG-8 WAC10335]